MAAVLLFHAGRLPGGYLGVSAFFTLSGFLICRLALAEIDTSGAMDLRRFWARRARRLSPAALVCVTLVVVYAAVAAPGGQVRGLGGDVLAALGYVANWRFVAAGRDYAQLFADPSPLQHFWSLAIEEQFYVVFPLVLAAVLWLLRRRPHQSVRAALAAVLAAMIVASIATTALASLIHRWRRGWASEPTRHAVSAPISSSAARVSVP